MQVCPHCGHENDDDATFCANRSCGEVLRWSRTEDDPDQQDLDEQDTAGRARALAIDLPPDPRQAPKRAPTGGQGRHAVRAFLSTEELEATPGDEVTCELRIHNAGTVVDQFTAEVLGAAAEWATCEPAAVNVYPDRDEVVVVRFRPPRGPTPAAGPMPFGIRVVSTQEPTASAEQQGTVHVQPFRRVTVDDLEPRTAEARRTATFHLPILNTGNTAESLTVEGEDPDNLLALHAEPSTTVCQPGETRRVAITARAHGLLWTGDSRRRNFAVEVHRPGEPGDPPIAEVPGALRQRVILWGWLPRLLGLFVLALIAIGALLFFTRSDGPAEVPEVVGRSVDEARELLSDAGLELGRTVSEVLPDREPGTIAEQNPQPGQTADPGTAVDVVVAQGEEVVAVPSLTGRSLAEAQGILDASQLAAGAIIEEASGLDPGTVLAQEPAPPDQVRVGSTVDLLVAVAADEETEAPTDDPPPPPPDEGGDGPDLAVAVEACSLVPQGAASGADALTIFLRVPNLAPEFAVEQGVLVTIDSAVGLSGSAVGGVTDDTTVRDTQVELGPEDYQGTVDFRVTVDPDNEIAEADEGNNQLIVRVGLPEAQPAVTIDPLPCEQVG